MINAACNEIVAVTRNAHKAPAQSHHDQNRHYKSLYIRSALKIINHVASRTELTA